MAGAPGLVQTAQSAACSGTSALPWPSWQDNGLRRTIHVATASLRASRTNQAFDFRACLEKFSVKKPA